MNYRQKYPVGMTKYLSLTMVSTPTSEADSGGCCSAYDDEAH